jgi:undecaprenyl-diphosphatase
MDMEILRTAVLGIVQGLSEFLPISSSGHLEIAKFLLGDTAVGEESLMMTVMLHFATALSTLYVFRKDVWNILKELFRKTWNEGQEFTLRIIVSMIPAGLIGFFFEPIFETLFSQRVGFVGFMLLITAAMLFIADKPHPVTRPLKRWDALWIGFAQAVALLPGISRSGSTLAASLYLGIDRYQAARFSFLMVVPLILGKIAYELLLGEGLESSVSTMALIVGFGTAFVFGVIACKWMIRLVLLSKLKYFGFYCIAAGMFAIILSIVARG